MICLKVKIFVTSGLFDKACKIAAIAESLKKPSCEREETNEYDRKAVSFMFDDSISKKSCQLCAD